MKAQLSRLPKFVERAYTVGTYSKKKKRTYQMQNQEVYWLQLLQLLKEGKEEKSLNHLSLNTFKKCSWQSDLETQLKRVLHYRLHGSFDSISISVKQIAKDEKKEQGRHQLFTLLDQCAEENAPIISVELKELLDSDDAIATVFMAADWIEAALQLQTMQSYSENFPDWVPFGFTQCLRQNRDVAAALAFAQRQPESDQLQLIIGEMKVVTGEIDGALEAFRSLLDSGDDVALRAAWLLGNLLIEQKNFTEAKKMLQKQHKFSELLSGKEMLARIAMLEGNVDCADRLYTLLEEESLEAKTYLARRAFQQQQYGHARKLTEKLLDRVPTHPVLRKNLQEIDLAEKQIAQR